jgi:hypothetical protein
MDLKPGSRWRSAVCDGEFVIVRSPKTAGDLHCGGHPVLPHSTEKPAGLSPGAEHEGETATGKRYSEPESGIEVLCSKAGRGALAIAGRPLVMKDAKPLPASD